MSSNFPHFARVINFKSHLTTRPPFPLLHPAKNSINTAETREKVYLLLCWWSSIKSIRGRFTEKSIKAVHTTIWGESFRRESRFSNWLSLHHRPSPPPTANNRRNFTLKFDLFKSFFPACARVLETEFIFDVGWMSERERGERKNEAGGIGYRVVFISASEHQVFVRER